MCCCMRCWSGLAVDFGAFLVLFRPIAFVIYAQAAPIFIAFMLSEGVFALSLKCTSQAWSRSPL